MCFAGVLYSGNIYMPLDVKSPKDRLESIIKNIQPHFMITDENNKDKLKGIFEDEKILLIDELIKDVDEIKTNHQNLIDTDPAYIINTSGSTGTPKGVVVSHRSIIDYIEWILAEEKIRPCSDDVIGNQSPFYFDKSLFDIYPTFAVGNKLILIPEEKFLFPIEALKFVEQQNINYIYWVPSILTQISNLDLLSKICPKLDKIFFGGESMSAKVLNYFKKYYPDAVFGNLYGPSEITDICSRYIVDRDFSDAQAIPIGKPCRNTQILLIDENNQIINEPNIIGELYVRGSCLSLQYFQNLKKSSEVFIQNPTHHKYYDKVYKTGDIGQYNEFKELILMGRKDYQIKHNGYRIELGEIEIALSDFKVIESLCVMYENNEIILCYQSKIEIEKKAVFEHLKNKIAKYMYPQKLLRIEKMPLNANGKIDRIALKEFIKKQS
ncbi:AMP-binding protein [Helicobacter sp. 13S00482-2]|uniref:AMP-binding protein n=1 Tax=Helicobacter sp. 13S00482-2 TaxID=1476200 RepID=UPI0015DB5C1F|nr:AMP-binding protein [Helicobacter sp. 13S00482-2]